MDLVTIYPPGASLLASYGASAINLGSWLNVEAAMDFGSRDLIQSRFSENALTDGGRFSFRHAPPRKWAIPLIINQPGTTTPQVAVRYWEAALARALTPGAMVSVQPEGVPTAQAVFFDVIDGRWEPEYNLFEHRANVRKGSARFETQPFGYWPTEILLASAASIGFLGQMAVNGASIIGDVPPLAHLSVMPTVASTYGGGGPWTVDMLAYSLAARPSFVPFISPASLGLTAWINGAAPTLIGDQFAPASQAMRYGPSGPVGITGNVAVFDTGTYISSALEPAYRGRFRVFGFWKQTPSWLPLGQVVVDADRISSATKMSLGVATSNVVATVYAVPTVVSPPMFAGSIFSPSPGYEILDHGEITLPPYASGVQGPVKLRGNFFITTAPPSTGSMAIYFGGLFLLPVDGPAGILPIGLGLASAGAVVPINLPSAQQGGAEFNAALNNESLNIIAGVNGAVASPGQPVNEGRAWYRGLSPRLGASVTSLVLLTGDRQFHPSVIAQMNVERSQVMISYRPTFQFLYGI